MDAEQIQKAGYNAERIEVEARLQRLVGQCMEIGPGMLQNGFGGLARLVGVRPLSYCEKYELTFYGLWLTADEDRDLCMRVGRLNHEWSVDEARDRLPRLEDRLLTDDSYRMLVEPLLEMHGRFFGGLM